MIFALATVSAAGAGGGGAATGGIAGAGDGVALGFGAVVGSVLGPLGALVPSPASGKSNARIMAALFAVHLPTWNLKPGTS